MRLVGVAFAALLMAAAMPALADVVVVKVSGPIAQQLRVGMRLPATKEVKLGKSDRITVLDAKGTREFVGQRTVRLDARQTPSSTVASAWAQRGMRARGAATRGGSFNGGATQLAELTNRAQELLDKGEFDEARATLAKIDASDYSHAVTCRMVENLRLFLAIADGSSAPPTDDPCADLPVPANMATLMMQLDEEKADLERSLALLAE